MVLGMTRTSTPPRVGKVRACRGGSNEAGAGRWLPLGLTPTPSLANGVNPFPPGGSFPTLLLKPSEPLKWVGPCSSPFPRDPISLRPTQSSPPILGLSLLAPHGAKIRREIPLGCESQALATFGQRLGRTPQNSLFRQKPWVPLGNPIETHLCLPQCVLCIRDSPLEGYMHVTSAVCILPEALLWVSVMLAKGADTEGRSVSHFSVSTGTDGWLWPLHCQPL